MPIGKPGDKPIPINISHNVPLVPGNIDLKNRPVVHNDDGSISTVRSITVTDEKGRATLIPTVIRLRRNQGRVVSNDEAIKHYQKTGQHLGIFKDEDSANQYAEQLHQSQATRYTPKHSFQRVGG